MMKGIFDVAYIRCSLKISYDISLFIHFFIYKKEVNNESEKEKQKNFQGWSEIFGFFVVVGNVIQNFNLLYVALMHGDEYLHLHSRPGQ